MSAPSVYPFRRLIAVAAVLALVVAGVQAAGASASAPRHAAPRHAKAAFKRVPGGTISTSLARLASTSNRRVSVMVQLRGAPVTVADAAHPLSAKAKTALKSQLASRQSAVSNRVRSTGGRVLASYKLVYNGLRVSVPANKIPQLAKIPNVIGVHALTPKTFDNVHGVPLVGAPQVWQGASAVGPLAGEGINVAIIDTGIDYTHADFGGPGTVAAYKAALADDTNPADPALFGPSAPRIKGGTDLVGDAYNAAGTGAALVPHPDPNPLDCAGHGTHVAGTAAGSGVLANGSTYTGGYNADTVADNDWFVGPGAAPRANIYSIRVFGCTGSTDVVIDAIEWAVAHDMDVINMSLGSPFGAADDPDAVASNNAAHDGVIVVASAGNNGPNPYIDGSPATATQSISVAAEDPTSGFPAATVTLSSSPSSPLTAINANGVSVAGLGTLPVKVLHTGSAISLGCDPNEYTNANVTGDLVVVQRGTCARVARAVFGQKAGAAAVLMINNTNDYPPFEGHITSNPDTGEQYNVTIPFLGVPSSAAAALSAADGGTATFADTTLANPGYLGIASFSSGGPRTGDSALKPDVTAPGVSIASAGMGTGTQPAVMSGTSMAAPHTTGVAALVRQAHPRWKQVKYWKAAIVNTANADMVAGYSTRLAGAGLIQAPPAVQTSTVAIGDKSTATLSYGYGQLISDYSATHTVTLHNFGTTPATFTIGHAHDAGSPHSLVLPASVTVPAKGTASVPVELDVAAATAGDSSAFHDVAGLVTFTPTGTDNSGVTLAVPYYLVPQALSNITVSLSRRALAKDHTTTATVKNAGGAIAGNADWYAWGLTDGKDDAARSADVRAVGVQAFPGVLAFAVSTYRRWSNAAADEFDIFVNVNGDATDDYQVVAADLGALQTGVASGQDAVAVFDMRTGAGTIQFLTDAPTDSTTMVLPVNISQLCASGSPCLSSANPRLSYHAMGFSPTGSDTVDGTAKFNAFSPAISTGMFDTVAPDATATETVNLNPTEYALTPPLGVMVVSHDNRTTRETRLFQIQGVH